jgi:hypothetical protein
MDNGTLLAGSRVPSLRQKQRQIGLQRAHSRLIARWKTVAFSKQDRSRSFMSRAAASPRGSRRSRSRHEKRPPFSSRAGATATRSIAMRARCRETTTSIARGTLMIRKKPGCRKTRVRSWHFSEMAALADDVRCRGYSGSRRSTRCHHRGVTRLLGRPIVLQSPKLRCG